MPAGSVAGLSSLIGQLSELTQAEAAPLQRNPEPTDLVALARELGDGIAEADLPFIFERFYRADRSRGRLPGSGIGLTVARELVVANGGSVEVESTGSRGTTFRIGLSSG